MRDGFTVAGVKDAGKALLPQQLRPRALESWELREHELGFGVWYRVVIILLGFLGLWLGSDSRDLSPVPAAGMGLALVIQPLYIWLLHRGPERWLLAARSGVGLLQMAYAAMVAAISPPAEAHLEAIFPAVLLEVAACTPGRPHFLRLGLAGLALHAGGIAIAAGTPAVLRQPWFWGQLGATVMVLLGCLYYVGHMQQMALQAHTDGLTRLYNRRYLLSRLQNEIASAGRKGQPVGVAVLDLDGFKEVNDRCGHLVGDRVLRAVAAALTRSVRAGDCVCRYGGDEFVLLFPGTSTEEGLVATRRALDSLGQMDLDRPLPPVSASAGLATFPDHALTAFDLLSKADLALVQQAKKMGRGAVAVYRSYL